MASRQTLIGKKVFELSKKESEYLNERWPGVDDTGTIREVYDADNTPENATLIDWTVKRGEFTFTETDGDRGFDAILED